MIRSSQVIASLVRWMRNTVETNETIRPEHVTSWADMLKTIDADLVARENRLADAEADPLIALAGDRINAVEADLIVDQVHQRIKRLSYLAEQAATAAELIQIDDDASYALDAVRLLAGGVSRPVQPQNQTGA